MKKTIFCLPIFFMLHSATAQYSYPRDIYTTADLHVNGSIKKLTETTVEIDKKGKKLYDESDELKFVYQFDNTGNVTRKDYCEVDEDGDESGKETTIYQLNSGKLTKETLQHSDKSTDTRFFSYAGNTITIKDGASGQTRQIRTVTNGRLSEIRYYNSGSTSTYDTKENFEYNAYGQVTKKLTTTRYGTDQQKYSYNSQGDIIKREEYDFNGKLNGIETMVYTYDAKNNWTKCIASWSNDEDTREQTTRTYEYDAQKSTSTIFKDEPGGPTVDEYYLVALKSDLEKLKGIQIYNRKSGRWETVLSVSVSRFDSERISCEYKLAAINNLRYDIRFIFKPEKINLSEYKGDAVAGLRRVLLDTKDASAVSETIYEEGGPVRGASFSYHISHSPGVIMPFPSSMSIDDIKKHFKQLTQ